MGGLARSGGGSSPVGWGVFDGSILCRKICSRLIVPQAFRVKGYQVKTKEDLIKEGYPSPHHDRYYCYVFDEEVNLGTFDIERIISTDRINYSSEIYQSRSITKKYPEGKLAILVIMVNGTFISRTTHRIAKHS